jgi:proline iminopeptidase
MGRHGGTGVPADRKPDRRAFGQLRRSAAFDAAQDAIQAAKSTGNFSTPEFEAANEVFEASFGTRTPREQRQLPACAATPVRFNAQLYEYMWGPSEFVANGTLRDYDRFAQLSALKLPTLFLVGEFDEARPETAREFQAQVPGSIVKVIAGAGHGVTVDQTAAFNTAIEEFIRGAE